MNSQFKKLKNLFLQQSYYDAWETYERQLTKKYEIVWDYVILTASNEEQASIFRSELQYRNENNLLPKMTHFAVIADPNGDRVGSGGATLNVLKYIHEDNGHRENFYNKRILVIHSGGDSKRVPQYSVCGKLFAPVPRELPNGIISTLFDEFMIATSMLPSRLSGGMVVLSGDVLLLFNALQIDPYNDGATAISFKEHKSIGKNHGVFLNNGNDFVDRFLHKQSEEELTKIGAVNINDNVDLDTGAIILSPKIVQALFEILCEEHNFSESKFKLFVNKNARLSFYGDFLYPLAEKATLNDYLNETPEGEFCDELTKCRKLLWDALSHFKLKLSCLSPAEFIHFGTTKELLNLVTDTVTNYEYLGWKKHVLSNMESSNNYAVSNSIIHSNAKISENSYIENSYIEDDVEIGKNTIVSCLELSHVVIPENVVLHGVRLKEHGYVVRIYGIEDNPKLNYYNGKFLGESLKEFVDSNSFNIEDIWEDSDTSLWNANLFPICDSWHSALEMALIIYKVANKTASNDEVNKWIKNNRVSLHSSFVKADGQSIIPMKVNLENRILSEKLINRINIGGETDEALKILHSGLNESQYNYLIDRAHKAKFSEKIRIYNILSKAIHKKNGTYRSFNSEEFECLTFDTIKQVILENAIGKLSKQNHFSIIKDEVQIAMPVRLNWGGGWTDTPPYCLENGGVVLNAAIKLKGDYPVRVTLRKIKELHIEFESIDISAKGVFTNVEEIQQCNNPYDPFSLHKAALIACGVIPRDGTVQLNNILKSLGGGIYLSTQVINVPKGSGLGTSSILAGACVKGISEFMGVELEDTNLYDIVLCMEQLMSTGGGWQDQVGGLTTGIKFITTKAGIDQKINVEQINLTEDTRNELNSRLTLIYTGQRRLARNLLRDVIGKYISGKSETISALHDMSRIAALMKFELEQGDVDAFAKLLNEHWNLSVKMDSGSTNTCIEQIFLSCEDLIDGRFIAGAGGGGFLQVILKKGVTKDMLQERLYRIFQDSGVSVWDCEITA